MRRESLNSSSHLMFNLKRKENESERNKKQENPLTHVLIIDVKNKLLNTRGCIEVYHHYTRITDTVNYNHSITIPLQRTTANQQEDYLRIELVGDSVQGKAVYLVDLPSWVNYYFSAGKIKGITVTNENERILLKVATGASAWGLKISRPTGAITVKNDYVTISDHQI
jgi:hypothetical protein